MTEAGLKYLDIVKKLVKNNQGQIEAERSYLDRQRDLLNVPIAEANRIEQRVLHAYQLFLNQAQPADAPKPPAQFAQSANQLTQDTDQPAPLNPYPPEPSYGTKLEQYRQIFAQALDANQLADEATQEQLWQLQQELHLDGQDVAHVEQQVLDDRSFNPSRSLSVPSPVTQPPSLPADDSLPPTELQSSQPLSLPTAAEVVPEDYQELAQHLSNQDWRQADRATLEIMLRFSDRVEDGWLSSQAIAAFPCADLDRIDQLWQRYSQGRFGFRPQYQHYSTAIDAEPSAISPAQTIYTRALELSKTIGWWQQGAHFHKYYNQLLFTIDAPEGHLPALWYWRIPWWRTLQFGGVGTGRGGCRVDAEAIEALMKRLQECDATRGTNRFN
jgi:hypothetical protein